MRRTVEICVETPADALAAQVGGADRVELCRDRPCGGVTPPAADVRDACTHLAIAVHVLIRPRAGDFCYAPDELRQMHAEIDMARAAGAAGVVLGVLDASRRIDRDATAALIARARPLSVTFHKAFDDVPDPFAALDELIALGVDRLLTSGQAATVAAGADLLARLAAHASGRIVVMAGGSLTKSDLPALRASGLAEIHAGSCILRDGAVVPGLVRDLAAAWRGEFEN